MNSDINLGFEIKTKLLNLQTALLEHQPNMPTLLRDIHSHLSKDKSIVTLMSEEEIAIVVSGLKRQTATELAVSAVKSKGGGKTKPAAITADDL